MPNLEREFSAAVESAERNVLIGLIRSHPEMSLADIGRLSKGRFSGLLSTVTVGELLGGSVGSKGGSGRGKNGSRAPSVGGVDTRTPAGRKQYDQAVLEIVKASAGPISAHQVRAAIGGTPLQARKALNRLIEQGKLSFEGKARATKYSIS